jgi:hypothetical protein
MTDDLDLVPMETPRNVKDKNKTALEVTYELAAETHNKHLEELKVGRLSLICAQFSHVNAKLWKKKNCSSRSTYYDS